MNFYGGPQHGRSLHVEETVAFVSDQGGHYMRMDGAFYWVEGPAPFATSLNGGPLRLVVARQTVGEGQ